MKKNKTKIVKESKNKFRLSIDANFTHSAIAGLDPAQLDKAQQKLFNKAVASALWGLDSQGRIK